CRDGAGCRVRRAAARGAGAGQVSTERTGCGIPRAGDAGTRMTVFGWVDRRRDHGGLVFLDLRDHSGILQVVINPETAPQAYDAVHGVRLEYVMRVSGTLRPRES